MDKKMKWYALRVVSGKERKVKEYLDKLIEKEDKTKYVEQVVLPLERVYKVRNGKKYTTDRNIFPGYILVESNMNPEVMDLIERSPNVIHFLKNNRLPIPLKQHEIDRMLSKIDEKSETSEYDIPFVENETVEITDGPFKSFKGDIVKINREKRTVSLNVLIFGRETPLELSFLQIDKIV